MGGRAAPCNGCWQRPSFHQITRSKKMPKGDNPNSRGDHWWTYRNEGNHGLIRAALSDKLRGAEV